MTRMQTEPAIPIPAWAIDAMPAEVRAELDEFATLMRDPADVLSPTALHTITATRFSFANTLVERMVAEHWKIDLRTVRIAADGTGYLGYELEAAGLTMSFGCYAYPPMDVDRVSLFRDPETDYFAVLAAGPLDEELMQHERDQFDTDLWRGRADDRVYGWTVARRGRLFEPVVAALADGNQPSRDAILKSGGYLLRNGGYYGNGRMGTRAWAGYARDGWPFESPYHVDLMTLYMWRLVGFDVADALARARGDHAVELDPGVKRYLGVGNSSGLGTIAALVRWPNRMASFVLPREIALAYAKSRRAPIDENATRTVGSLLRRARETYATVPDPGAGLVEPRLTVADALERIAAQVDRLAEDPGRFGQRPWLELAERSTEYGSAEAVDLLHSFLIDAYPETAPLRRLPVVGARQPWRVDPVMTLGALRELIEMRFAWVLEIDFAGETARHFFWYRSEENGENRRGERSVDVGVERETFIDVSGAVRRLYDFILSLREDMTVGRFLLEEPEHTLTVNRVQLAGTVPYSEFQADICDAGFRASDGIRAFLALLGLEIATPVSARWVRGVFFRGAPLPADIAAGADVDWRFPTYPDDHVEVTVG